MDELDEFTEAYLNDRPTAEKMLNDYDKLDAMYAVAIAMRELQPSDREHFFRWIESLNR